MESTLDIFEGESYNQIMESELYIPEGFPGRTFGPGAGSGYPAVLAERREIHEKPH